MADLLWNHRQKYLVILPYKILIRTVYYFCNILAQFDNIAYAKGGSILKMVIHAMGEERWRSGMQKYLNQNAYINTDGAIWFR